MAKALLQARVGRHTIAAGVAAEVEQKVDARQKARVREETEIIRSKSKSHVREAQTSKYTPGDTVNEYCDATGLASMHGYVVADDSKLDQETKELTENIINDVTKELEENNVDQMAKDVFTFYVCARWVPDDVLWKVAEQELAAEILETVVNEGDTSTQAIAELYQNFKFVPLLCSRNIKVYEEKSEVDHTFFRHFNSTVSNFSNFLTNAENGAVWNRLKQTDELFCGSNKMNSEGCDLKLKFNEWVNRLGQFVNHDMGMTTEADGWDQLETMFRSFGNSSTWPDGGEDFNQWKRQMPYHSFLAKPAGASSADSPTSEERFLVCFGMRVASELHRRPRGDHIITDQNNVGCHGWWTASQVGDMLNRITDLWKPPTCQLAEMTYHMKHEILKMFMRMNEQLFDALPSMLQDEQLDAEGVDVSDTYPKPFEVASVELDGQPLYDGQRVAASKDLSYEKPDCWFFECEDKVAKGTAGTLHVKADSSEIKAVWDGETDQERTVQVGDFKVVPREYGMSSESILDKVVGWTGSTLGSAADLFNSLWGGQQTSLASMMSGSIAKWVVCPVMDNVNFTELDQRLGTEDEAFQEHVREAYSKWTGYEKPVPGEQCVVDDEILPPEQFPGCSVCEITEMHANHPERFTHDDLSEEPFVCPLIPPLEDPEQVKVFQEKDGMCLLHMTQKQKRQNQWHYRGYWPARKQNNKQENPPLADYELVKILDVANSAGPEQVSFGRTCSLEEAKEHPRLCGAPELAKAWPSLQDMAGAVGEWLQGSLGMPVSAISGLINNYQKLMATETNEEAAQMAATMVGEEAWKNLMGIGRLAYQQADSMHAEVAYNMEGDDMRHARMSAQLFGYGHAGEFLHSMSYQKDIGASGTTSNSKDRYSRYAVVCPCADFDPGMELALRWEWSQVAIRAMKEAMHHQPAIMEKLTPEIKVRAEGRLFYREQEETENSTWFTYGAAIEVDEVEAARTEEGMCAWQGSWYSKSCQPEDQCEVTGWWPNRGCERIYVPTNNWRVVWDQLLAKAVGGKPGSQVPPEDLKAMKVKYYCGPKSAFKTAVGQGPEPATADSLKACMVKGVAENAAMRAAEPWKLFHPEEVIVVAVFDTFEDRHCSSTNEATKGQVCPETEMTPQENLDGHLSGEERASHGGEYRGMTTGFGYPSGIVKEVVLKPEDILQATSQLI
eukprot:TRINITY_DN27026_c0_g1_i2.p1 TRINITY_DN27026_c0_g1~~TRINITY_DN27026_c0_g1_i2.p1  ORF type:complete len:1181 (+),score=375.14 TRINITY_DN27026_c0_g1_i2:344-3886(+)